MKISKKFKDGKIWYLGNLVNRKMEGYWEWYYNSPNILQWKGNFINDENIGYFEHYRIDGELTHKEFYL
jgi:hypothetical protein